MKKLYPDAAAALDGVLADGMTIASGGIAHHVKDFCRQHRVDLVICGNHTQSLFSRATCSAKDIVGSSGVDVLLVCLEKG